jgi:hypothetical protein
VEKLKTALLIALIALAAIALANRIEPLRKLISNQ